MQSSTLQLPCSAKTSVSFGSIIASHNKQHKCQFFSKLNISFYRISLGAAAICIPTPSLLGWFANCSTGYIIHKNLKFKLLKGLAVNDQTNPEGKKHLHGRTNREGKDDQHNVKSGIHLQLSRPVLWRRNPIITLEPQRWATYNLKAMMCDLDDVLTSLLGPTGSNSLHHTLYLSFFLHMAHFWLQFFSTQKARKSRQNISR